MDILFKIECLFWFDVDNKPIVNEICLLYLVFYGKIVPLDKIKNGVVGENLWLI